MKAITTLLSCFSGCLMLSLLFTSCEMHHNDSGKLYLRQLVNTKENVTHASMSYFLIYGSYSSTTSTIETIKMYANVNGTYRLLEYNLRDIGIQINNNDSIPYLRITFESSEKWTIEEIVENSTIYSSCKLTVVCPEKYLPEKLLPIQLN